MVDLHPFLPLSDCREDEEHPEVDAQHQEDLEDQLPQDGLPQIESSINDHGAELDQQHYQEGFRNLVLRQGGSDVCCCRVFLKRDFGGHLSMKKADNLELSFLSCITLQARNIQSLAKMLLNQCALSLSLCCLFNALPVSSRLISAVSIYMVMKVPLQSGTMDKIGTHRAMVVSLSLAC